MKVFSNYIDHIAAVVTYYEERKLSGQFPQRLLNPTPGNLRKECVSVFNDRFDRKDTLILKTFFEIEGDIIPVKKIEKFALDKFKPLSNFLKGITSAPDDKNIELLGWLIDFPTRPFDRLFNYDFYKKELPEKIQRQPLNEFSTTTAAPGRGVLPAAPVPDAEPASHDPDENQGRIPLFGSSASSGKAKNFLIVAGITFVLGFGYWSHQIGNDNKIKSAKSSTSECMIWTGEKYEAIACDSLPEMSSKITLDPVMLRSFRRITRPDTLSLKHLSKVWYRKRAADSLDYFTGGGMDPVDPEHDLHRLTRH
ncbi:MAG: hypothetical protein EOO05_21680, partial [Chitinophagaceae bacterium]